MSGEKTTEQAVLDSLTRNGAMTLAQVAGNIKRPKMECQWALQELLKEGKVKVVKDGWQVVNAVPRYPRVPAWTLGKPIKDGWWT